MSEHPPVPCPDPGCGKPLRLDGGAFLCENGTIFTSPWGLTADEWPDLWREWTRGKAVVPLPKPTRAEQWEAGEHEDIYWEAHLDADEFGPLIYFQAGERWLGVDSTRAFAAALLAAADLAEQQAAAHAASGGEP